MSRYFIGGSLSTKYFFVHFCYANNLEIESRYLEVI